MVGLNDLTGFFQHKFYDFILPLTKADKQKIKNPPQNQCVGFSLIYVCGKLHELEMFSNIF